VTDLQNARMLVTGAASGIGREMALAAAQRGARIIAWDMDAVGLDRLSGDLRTRGTDVHTFVVDVTDREAIYRTAASVEEDLGGIDVLVLNAGIVDGATILEGSDEMLERVMGVNVLALFWCTKAFVPGMVERGHGHVVTIASITSLVPTPGMATYTVSKHAAYGFGETLRTELRSHAPGVHTSVVMPFFVSTGMFAGAGTVRLPFFNKHLEPAEVGERVVAAIEGNHERVIMPGIGVMTQAMRALPPGIYDAIAERVGLFSVMSHFHGRAGATPSSTKD
jgi:all-trans-retinol dehydrogenase (NAD+)